MLRGQHVEVQQELLAGGLYIGCFQCFGYPIHISFTCQEAQHVLPATTSNKFAAVDRHHLPTMADTAAGATMPLLPHSTPAPGSSLRSTFSVSLVAVCAALLLAMALLTDYVSPDGFEKGLTPKDQVQYFYMWYIHVVSLKQQQLREIRCVSSRHYLARHKRRRCRRPRMRLFAPAVSSPSGMPRKQARLR